MASSIWQNADYTPQDANGVGANVYELLLANWGSFGGNSDDMWPVSGAQGFPLDVAAIAIGPLSTVDRCYTTWNPNKALPAAPIGGYWQRIRRLTLAAPLLFPQTAKQGSATNPATAAAAGALFVFPELPNVPGTPDIVPTSFPVDSTVLPDNGTYLKADGTNGAFGNGVAPFNTIYQAPFLHLYFYLTKSGILTPQPARRPLVVRNSITPVPGGAEACVAQIPVYGRNCIQIGIAATGAANNTLRVGAVRGVNSKVVPIETTEGLRTAIASGATQSFQISAGGAIDYLTLYATPGADAQVDYVVVATD